MIMEAEKSRPRRSNGVSSSLSPRAEDERVLPISTFCSMSFIVLNEAHTEEGSLFYSVFQSNAKPIQKTRSEHTQKSYLTKYLCPSQVDI